MPGYPHIGVVPAGGVPAVGTTLLDLCCRVADTVGSRLAAPVTSTPVGAEPERVVLVDEARDDESGHAIAAGDWLYVASGEQARTQRRIVGGRDGRDAGYLGTMGGLVVSRPFSAPVAQDAWVHVTAPLPMRRHLGVPGYREAINAGLALIWTQARLEVPGPGDRELSLNPYSAYLQRGELQIVGIADTRGGGSGDPATPTGAAPTVVMDGAEHTLILPTAYATSETFFLDVLIKADRLIHDGSDWYIVEAGPPGLADDGDMCACPGDWAYVFGAWKAYQWLTTFAARGLADGRLDAAACARERAIWAAAARRIKEYEMPGRAPFGQAVPVGVAMTAW